MFNLVAKIFGAIGLATLLFLGWNWLWLHPQAWNGTAGRYLAHSNKLERDSARWHRDSTGFVVTIAGKDSVIRVRDSTITLVTGEMQKAIGYGRIWQDKYNSAVVQSDATTDRLTDREREVAYYKALQSNGTLTVRTVGVLSPSSPQVVSAGLKTANREAIGTKARDSLSLALGNYMAANERLGKGLTIAGSRLSSISKQARENLPGGLWPFNRRRKKELRALADSADKARKEVQDVSDLERNLNGGNW